MENGIKHNDAISYIMDAIRAEKLSNAEHGNDLHRLSRIHAVNGKADLAAAADKSALCFDYARKILECLESKIDLIRSKCE